MSDPGIDYSGGTKANRDPKTGIHYGVIPMNSLSSWAWEEMEADYGDPTCPKCGNEVVEYDGDAEDEHGQYSHSSWLGYTNHGCCDYACETCEHILDSEDVYGDEPSGYSLDDGECKGFVDSSGDFWVIESPYYSRSQYCSPCAPGAGYLTNPCEDGPKTYCLDHSWFEDDVAPYPVYRVDNNERVYSGKENEEVESNNSQD